MVAQVSRRGGGCDDPGGHEPVDPVSGHATRWTSPACSGSRWSGRTCACSTSGLRESVGPTVLGDHFAAQDVARIDYDFKRIHRRVHPVTNQFGVALRGAQLDTWTADYLSGHPDAVVLHLGCGLHSRAFRLAVPEGVRWFDVDLPQVIALRRQLYSESDPKPIE